MPAAAVIPAPIAYIKIVAVKKLVVGSAVRACGPPRGGTARPDLHRIDPRCSSLSDREGSNVYFEKIRVFIAGSPPE